MDKRKLDELLITYKVQPVGHGYIDMIVKREQCEPFVIALIENGFEIESVSWWEWCPKDQRNDFGMGGPKSDFYEGWFAELNVDIDDVKINGLSKELAIKQVMSLIESKKLKYPDVEISYIERTWLTPALWVKVPDEWRNEKSAQPPE